MHDVITMSLLDVADPCNGVEKQRSWLERRYIETRHVKIHQRNTGRLLKTKPVFQTFSQQGVAWEDKWNQLVGDLYYHEDFNKSADQLRDIIKSEMLKFTDLRDNPERFFAAHRTLAERSTELGPGFLDTFHCSVQSFCRHYIGPRWRRATQNVGNNAKKGHLGCFALTEKFAGVNSGLVVNTDIEWDNEKEVFIMNTKDESARENWIHKVLSPTKQLLSLI